MLLMNDCSSWESDAQVQLSRPEATLDHSGELVADGTDSCGEVERKPRVIDGSGML